MKKIINLLLVPLLYMVCAGILLLSIRGIAGNPTSTVINQPQWKENGPFELSPDRGRFALALSIIENHSLYFSLPISRFATPDLGYKNGHYVSLFAPGISYLIIPGYLLGSRYDLGQVGMFAMIATFALLNALLIRAIALRLKAHPVAAMLASITFLFATPAYAYAVSLYQHHVSTFLILSSIYLLLRWKSIWVLPVVWFLCAASIPVDYPNLFLMFPIALYALGRVIYLTRHEKSVQLTFRIGSVFTFITVILPLAFFCWFNYASYGNPLQFSGTVAGVGAIDTSGKPTAPRGVDTNNLDKYLDPSKQHKSAVAFFNTRDMLNGLYEHLISQDRGILYFTPIMLLSIFGMVILYKRQPSLLAMLLGVIGADLLLYSMWGDPYGGWAFGSRYMIPSYAIMSLCIAVALTYYRKYIVALLLFCVLFVYSVSVNTLGALTSNSNPPKVEVLGLEKITHQQQRFSYDRNYHLLLSNTSKSFMWQTYFQNSISAYTYWIYLVSTISGIGVVLLILLAIKRKGGVYVD